MKSIHIRDVPEDTLEALKRLARYHHRSLQRELHAVLEDAAGRAPETNSTALQLRTVKVDVRGNWSREEIYDDGAR